MLKKFKSSFINMEGDYNQLKDHGRKESTAHASSRKGLMAVGLQSLVYLSEGKCNVVLKSALKTHRPIPPNTNSTESCYLKSCYLCHRNLSLDKDVYMYRGDLGFCSIECRNRQICLDEMKDLEASTKQMLKSYRHCYTAEHQETRLLPEELRQRHKPLNIPQHQNHWTIAL